MVKAKVRPEYIHAYSRVGVLITEQNESVADPEVVVAWKDAVKEYRHKKRRK